MRSTVEMRNRYQSQSQSQSQVQPVPSYMPVLPVNVPHMCRTPDYNTYFRKCAEAQQPVPNGGSLSSLLTVRETQASAPSCILYLRLDPFRKRANHFPRRLVLGTTTSNLQHVFYFHRIAHSLLAQPRKLSAFTESSSSYRIKSATARSPKSALDGPVSPLQSSCTTNHRPCSSDLAHHAGCWFCLAARCWRLV
jgi:hypothetical protein